MFSLKYSVMVYSNGRLTGREMVDVNVSLSLDLLRNTLVLLMLSLGASVHS